MSNLDDGTAILAKVVVARMIDVDGELVDLAVTEDSNGDPLPLTEALGMLRLAEDSIIRSRMDDDGDPL